MHTRKQNQKRFSIRFFKEFFKDFIIHTYWNIIILSNFYSIAQKFLLRRFKYQVLGVLDCFLCIIGARKVFTLR